MDKVIENQIKQIIDNKYSDNYIIFNFPKELMEQAKNILSKTSTNNCFISLDSEIEKKLENTLNNFSNKIHKDIICRDLLITLFMKELTKDSEHQQKFLENGINVILSGDNTKIKDYHSHCPTYHDISKTIKLPLVLNIFLSDTKNIYLQRAINNYISSREPFSIRIFSNQSKFSTYYDQAGNIIQPIHDFRQLNIIKKYKLNEIEEEKY